jgi:hypothetical protein
MMTVLGVVAAIYGAAYFLPTIIACCRDVKGKGWVFSTNLLFGLSGFGYAIAMIQAFGPTNAELRAAAERERLSEEADRAIVAMERRSREALAHFGYEDHRHLPTLL